MKKIIKQMVQQKIKELTVEELISYSEQYDFSLTEKQAKAIIHYIKTKDLDPFNEKDRYKLLKKVASVTDEETAQKAYKLFKDLTKQYGVDHYF
ncbi:DUF2624 domain-containing protein [Salirhabdus salicampi]|uniref:DUF2624 domain-containing protein n=1 Tax=Salirhabdus salicampi TaxID=476102 RepID=UPI0020C376CE|nr:DUF2624 domain-containing protein [Salirhabdus salicampi]